MNQSVSDCAVEVLTVHIYYNDYKSIFMLYSEVARLDMLKC